MKNNSYIRRLSRAIARKKEKEKIKIELLVVISYYV